jgi:NDP-sugar pyrophosphorylase family protein
MKPQLIIPMSGIGERFQKVGYTEPKFLIKVLGKSIIEHVIDMFPSINDVLFIVNKEHCDNPEFRLREHLSRISPNAAIFEIEGHKKGPGWTIWEAKELIDLNRPVIVNYCDFNAIFDYEEFEKKLFSGIDGLILTYDGFHPHMIRSQQFAYVKKNQVDLVVDIKEKESFSKDPMMEEASAGTYGFRNGKILVDALREQLDLDYSFNDEYYISLTFKSMLRNNMKINTLKLKHFMQWGTPQDLDDFNYWSDIFLKLMNTANSEMLETRIEKLILAAGKGERFKNAGYEVSKPLLALNGKPIIKQILQILGLDKTTVLVRESQTELLNFLKKNKAKIKIIESETKGQAESAFFGIQELEDQQIIILPCDSILIVNDLNEITNEEFDIYVFTTKFMPNSDLNPEEYGWVNFDISSNKISQVKLKEKPDNFINWEVFTGSILAKSAHNLSELIKEIFHRDLKVNNEFYLDSVIDVAVSLGCRVIRREANLFISLGTPNEYQSFRYWESCFINWGGHPYSNQRKSLFN